MNSKKILPCGAVTVGGLIALVGITFTIMYVLEVIVAKLGELDQSLLFWYLLILFIGLTGIIADLDIGIWKAIRLRKIQQLDTISDSWPIAFFKNIRTYAV